MYTKFSWLIAVITNYYMHNSFTMTVLSEFFSSLNFSFTNVYMEYPIE